MALLYLPELPCGVSFAECFGRGRIPKIGKKKTRPVRDKQKNIRRLESGHGQHIATVGYQNMGALFCIEE